MVRDLTSNTVGRPDALNPFASELDHSDHTSSNSSFTSSSRNHSPNTQYGGRFGAYPGYYSQNGTSANLLSDLASNEGPHGPHDVHDAQSAPFERPVSAQDSFGAGPDQIKLPSEYDRYPSMAGSRVVSSTSLASQFRDHYHQYASEENSLEKSANPFAANVDFSPFGGYPASSFPLHIDEKEPDDYIHNPDPIADAHYDKNRFLYDLKNLDRRSFGGLVGLILMFCAGFVVFVLLPILTYSGATNHARPPSYEILTNYRYPLSSSIRTNLVDKDTPEEALWKENKDGEKWKLVFSEEFNAEGRTFYDGDDQFMQAVDIHYDATKDLEWYDPDAASTANGSLVLRMDAFKNHDLFYRSAMMQSWNKLCFTQGMILVSAMLPNYGSKTGLWPGLWTMGNLGRPGYLASTEGVWPYTYESCDAGITPNQSSPDGISFLPGQRLNSCTCKGEDHPNAGTGRGAPEIDIIEGEVSGGIFTGVASQSYQIAPMDVWYYPDMQWVEIEDLTLTSMNTYTGGPFQQAVSGTTVLNNSWYERGEGAGHYQIYGFELKNDNENGHLTWYVGEEPTLTLHAKALGPNGNVGPRLLSKEPMSIVMNFGVSNNWAYIDWPTMMFPSHVRVDNIRIYQPEDEINVTCDPDDYPTVDYIEAHKVAYMNPNLTSWEDTGFPIPKNKLANNCK